MKKILVVLIAAAFVVGLAGIASAAITGTKHDFSSSGTGQGANSSTEICKTCHVPHSAPGNADGPLWNHDLTTETFSTYVSATNSLDATLNEPGAAGGVSKLCLSCHDGVTAIDAYGGNTPTLGAITGVANLGNDLSDDHPISFTYDSGLAATDGELADPGATNEVGAGAYPLFASQQMECASCHDPHGTSNTKFLRGSLTNSALCLNCHVGK